MFGRDYKDKIIHYFENFYEFPEECKEKVLVDDFFFLDVVCNILKQLIIELHYSVSEIRAGALKIESVIIPVRFYLQTTKGCTLLWDLEKPYFLAAGGTN